MESDTSLQDAVDRFDRALVAALQIYLDTHPALPGHSNNTKVAAVKLLVSEDTLGWRTWAHAALRAPHVDDDFRRSLTEHLSQEALRLENEARSLEAARH